MISSIVVVTKSDESRILKEANIDDLVSFTKSGFNNSFNVLAFLPINKSDPLYSFVFACVSSENKRVWKKSYLESFKKLQKAC